MKKKVVELLAIFLAANFVFTLAGCSKKAAETTTLAATTAVDKTTAIEKTTVAAEETTANEGTSVADETTTVSETTTVIVDASTTIASTIKHLTTTKPAVTKPTTIADIVSYYNLAANKVKKDKPGYNLTSTNIIGKITSSSGLVEGLVAKIVPMFSTDPAKSSVAKGSNDGFPVKGQSYGSKLVPSTLKSATCIDKGSTYEITLNFKDEVLADLPLDPIKTKHGQAMNVLSASEVYTETDKFKFLVKMEKFAPTYTGCYIKSTIQKSTGNMLAATFLFVSDADIIAKAIVTVDAKVHFGVKDEYIFK